MPQDRAPADRAPAPARRTIRVLLEYDGTPYHGWQAQPQGPTIQSVLQEALRAITGEEARVKGAGRTDAGVHALGQVAAFRTATRLAPDDFRRALNSVLPPSVAVLAADEVPQTFDPQFSALWKTYRYRIHRRRDPSPLERNRSWHIHSSLDIESMRASSALLIGRRDFSSFRATGCAASSPVRTMRRLDLAESVDIITIECEADGFLRHMVRNIVGTLVEVGRGRFSTADFADILEARDRRRAGIAAPPWGLYLVRAGYGEEYGDLAPPSPAGAPTAGAGGG